MDIIIASESARRQTLIKDRLPKSEARPTEQRDLFLNEAEALAPTPSMTPAEEDTGSVVAAHHRKKPGRKPLDRKHPAAPPVNAV